MAIAPPPGQQPAAPTMPDNPLSGVTDTVKGCLGFTTALIIVGVIAEGIYNLSPKAAYLFVAIVILGYAASGANLTAVEDFLNSVTKTTTIPNGGRTR